MHMKKKKKPTAIFRNRSRDAHMNFCIAKSLPDALYIGGVRHLIFREQHHSQSSRLNQFQGSQLCLSYFRQACHLTYSSDFLHTFTWEYVRLSASLQIQGALFTLALLQDVCLLHIFLCVWERKSGNKMIRERNRKQTDRETNMHG